MALNTVLTTATGMSPTMQTYYDRKLLMSAKPKLVHYSYGQQVVLPKNQGKTIQFRKWTPFGALTTPLTEGAAPDGQSLSMTAVTSEIKQYGGYVAVSDLLDLTAIDPVVNDSIELMGDQGGLTIDTLVMSTISKSTNLMYANGKTARSQINSGSPLTINEIRKAVRTLKNNKAPQFIRGSKEYYVAIVSPDTTYDLQSDPLWQDVSKYSAAENIFDGEIGKMFGVVFVETTQAARFRSEGLGGADVFGTMVIGKNAYGVVDLESSNLRSIVKPRGSSGTSDPLDQISTVGWKVEGFACQVLQPLWMLRIEHGVTG